MPSVQEEFLRLKKYMNENIVGQEELINRLLIALLANGHLLVEGAPGLAKTKSIKMLSRAIDCSTVRIQFTPDLLPADITGSEVYRPQTGEFFFQKGPLFHNLVLVDEINRSPAKVQSALLEAMGESQITVGGKTYPLPDLFLVLATQNPIEQEGTYPLPEAQLDRFLMYVKINSPSIQAERMILKLVRQEELKQSLPIFEKISQETVMRARKEVLNVDLSDELQEYIVQFIMATRGPAPYGKDLDGVVVYGSSPRGTIALDICSRARAWLEGRTYVSPQDVRSVLHDVLRHRILLSFEAQAEGWTQDKVIDELIERVPLP